MQQSLGWEKCWWHYFFVFFFANFYSALVESYIYAWFLQIFCLAIIWNNSKDVITYLKWRDTLNGRISVSVPLHSSEVLYAVVSRTVTHALPSSRRTFAHSVWPYLAASIMGVSPRAFLRSISIPYLSISVITIWVMVLLPERTAWCKAVLPWWSTSTQSISLSFIISSTNRARCCVHAQEKAETPTSSLWPTQAPFWSKILAKDNASFSLATSQTRCIGVRMRESRRFTPLPARVSSLTWRALWCDTALCNTDMAGQFVNAWFDVTFLAEVIQFFCLSVVELEL